MKDEVTSETKMALESKRDLLKYKVLEFRNCDIYMYKVLERRYFNNVIEKINPLSIETGSYCPLCGGIDYE